MKGDPLPNLLAVLRALTAPEDGDEHPFLREAAKLEHVYLNPLGVAARVDGVRAQWSIRSDLEAVEILTARDLWPLAGVEPDVTLFVCESPRRLLTVHSARTKLPARAPVPVAVSGCCAGRAGATKTSAANNRPQERRGNCEK